MGGELFRYKEEKSPLSGWATSFQPRRESVPGETILWHRPRWSANRDNIYQVVRESQKVENRWPSPLSSPIRHTTVYYTLLFLRLDLLGRIWPSTERSSEAWLLFELS